MKVLVYFLFIMCAFLSSFLIRWMQKHLGADSDGHDKPLCTKAILIIDNFEKFLVIPVIDKSQFF